MTVRSQTLWIAEAEVSKPTTQMLLPPLRSRLRLLLQLSLFALDIIALSLAAGLAGWFWLGAVVNTGSVAIGSALIGFYVLINANAGGFSSDILVRRWRSIIVGIRSSLLAMAGVILAAFFLKAGAQISRVELVITGLVGSLLIGISRGVFQTLMHRRHGTKLHSEVLIIDDCQVDVPEGVHVLDAAAIKLRCDLFDPLMLDRLGRILAPADRVVIACSMERRRSWAMMLKGANIQAEIITPELTDIGPLGTGQFDNSATVMVAAGSLDLWQRLVKRGLDLSLAMLSLLILAPALVLVAMAIKLDSPGPVFFVQDRVGRGNRLFGIYKFRSMRLDSSDHSGSRSTSRDDDRITRIGRFIRATSIDELPQLLNILKGQMSFVGPRPHALGSLAGDMLFWEIDERYWHRHVCKPGMTGLAQIRGYRGATHQQSDLTNRLQADLEYVAGWTILRDVSILLATLRVVVHRNAY